MKAISKTEEKHLKIHNAIPSNFYDLLNTRNNILCLRPVVGCVNSHSYNFLTAVNNILTPMSTTFLTRKGYILISLELVSLFPNIPKPLLPIS